MYAKLLDITRRLNAAQKRADQASERYRSMDLRSTTGAQRASASDRLITASWERDKLVDELHCELVNLDHADAMSSKHYAPREITHNAGRGHTITFTYTPPVPDCVKEAL